MEYGCVAVCTQTLQPPTSVETVHRRPNVVHVSSLSHSSADHAPARSPPITQSPLSNPLLTSTLSHPLSYALAARQNTMLLRTAHAALALLAVFNVPSSLASPVT
eukprot:scaffold96293_cov67-Phaeocystis_antarctica.AAC.1